MIITDLSMTGLGHVFFNSAFIKMLAFSKINHITFIGERKHCMNIRARLSDVNVEYHEFKMKSRLGAGVFLQDFNGCLQLIKLFFSFPKNRKIVILNRLPFTLILCNLLNIFKHRLIFNVLHGELEYLVNPNIKGLTKYYYKFFKIAYLLSTNNNYYIFLGKSIYEETMKKRIGFGHSRHIVIDHPYDFNVPLNNININFSERINIGMIGTAMKRKNSHYMAFLRPLINNKLISICNIGRADNDLSKDLEAAKIKFFTANISAEKYEELVNQLDYSLCFYDDTINLALASGSFLDSIKFAKPILALKGNPYVDYYFKKFGNIGYQFDSIQDMANFINSMSHKHLKEYKEQVSNLREAQKILSIKNIAKDFQKQINNSI